MQNSLPNSIISLFIITLGIEKLPSIEHIKSQKTMLYDQMFKSSICWGLCSEALLSVCYYYFAVYWVQLRHGWYQNIYIIFRGLSCVDKVVNQLKSATSSLRCMQVFIGGLSNRKTKKKKRKKREGGRRMFQIPWAFI